MPLEVKYEISGRGFGKGNTPSFSVSANNNPDSIENLSRDVKNILINTSLEVLKLEQGKGFTKEPLTFVDGRLNTNLNAVKPFGKIEFVASVDVAPIVIEAFEGVVERSRVRSGLYKASHQLIYNNQNVAGTVDEVRRFFDGNPELKAKDRFQIVNSTPYARMLETRGYTADRGPKPRTVKGSGGKRVSAPNGAYHLTYALIRRKYKRNVLIRFEYLQGSNLGLEGSFAKGSKNKAGRPYLYPSLLIYLSSLGTNLN